MERKDNSKVRSQKSAAGLAQKLLDGSLAEWEKVNTSFKAISDICSLYLPLSFELEMMPGDGACASFDTNEGFLVPIKDILEAMKSGRHLTEENLRSMAI